MRVGDHRIALPQGRLFARAWHPGGEDAGREPVILLHDSLGCVELWRDFPERLAGALDRTVIAYDRLGFGRSDPYPGDLAPGFLRAEGASVAALRAALALERPILVGHSVGGGMALTVAGDEPDLVAAVITIAAQAFVEDRTLEGVRAARAAFREPGQVERLARYHGDKARWVLDAWTETWLAPDFAGWTLDEPLARVTCPVLALHGDRDEFGSPAHLGRIAAATAGSATIIEGAGHVPHREDPDRVIGLIAAFLDGHLPRPGASSGA